MRYAFKFRNTLFLILICLSAFACKPSEEDPTDPMEGPAIDAFNALKQLAQSNNGDAVLVYKGKSAVLKVDNQLSPLYGSEVTIPAGTFSASYTVVSIQESEVASDKLELQPIGPGVLITSVQVPVGVPVQPQKPLQLKLPHSLYSSGPAAALGIGLLSEHGKFSILPKSIRANDTSKVVGEISGMGLYVAAWVFGGFAQGDDERLKVIWEQLPFDYRVVDAAGKLICGGSLSSKELLSSSTFTISKAITEPSDGFDSLQLNLQLGTQAKLVVETAGDYYQSWGMTIPSAGSNSAESYGDDLSEVVLTCGGESYLASSQKIGLHLSTEKDVGTNTCGATCTKFVKDMTLELRGSLTSATTQRIDFSTFSVPLPGVNISLYE